MLTEIVPSGLLTACLWSFLRSGLLALLSLPVGWLLKRHLVEAQGTKRVVIWSAVLFPFFVPELLVGYAYYNFSLSLIQHPLWNELFYALLVGLKAFPVATVVLVFAPPPPISAAALHVRKLSLADTSHRLNRLRGLSGFYLRGPIQPAIPAASLVFLVAFQEFEMAGRMQTQSSTVWLFDAHAGGLVLSDSLRWSLCPLVIELAVVAPVLFFVLNSTRRDSITTASPPRLSSGLRILAWVYLATVIVVVAVIPFGIVGREAWNGIDVVAGNQSFPREIFDALVAGLVGGIGAYAIAAAALSIHKSQWRIVLALMLSIPGLFGPLILGLLLAGLFQQPGWVAVYDTPVPMFIGLVIWLIPRAILLQLLIRAVENEESTHAAALLTSSAERSLRARSREILWQLSGRRHFFAIILSCYWGYLNLTIPAILQPIGLNPAPLRLYNFIHYGRIAGLAAMLSVTVAAPLVLIPILLATRRLLFRWRN